MPAFKTSTTVACSAAGTFSGAARVTIACVEELSPDGMGGWVGPPLGEFAWSMQESRCLLSASALLASVTSDATGSASNTIGFGTSVFCNEFLSNPSLSNNARRVDHSLVITAPPFVTDPDTATTVVFGSGFGTTDYSTGGSWEIACTCDEWIELTPGPAPFFAAVPDSPYWTLTGLFLALRPGTTYSASATSGALSLTRSATVPAQTAAGTPDYPIGYSGTVTASLETGGVKYQGQDFQFAASATTAGTLTLGAASIALGTSGLPGSPGAVTATQDDVTSSAASGASVVVAGQGGVDFTLGGGTNASGAASATRAPDKPVTVSGVLQAMELPYPDDLTVSLAGVPGTATTTASGGSFAASGTQRQGSGSGSATCSGVTTNAAGLAVNTFGPVSATVTEASLVANGDDPRLTRLCIRGRQKPGATLTLASTYVIDACTAATVPAQPAAEHPGTWTGGTVAGGGIRGAAGAGLTRVFSPQLSAMSYRYLRVKGYVTGAAGADLTAAIPAPSNDPDAYKAWLGPSGTTLTDQYTGDEEPPEKTWNHTAGADGAEFTWYMDLAVWPGASLEDGQDSRWPLPTRMPRNYGVWLIEQIQFGGVPAGATLTITELAYVLHPTGSGFACDFLPTFYPMRGRMLSGSFVMDQEGDWPQFERPSETLDGGTTRDYYTRRFLHARADGRATAEEPDLSYVKSLTGSGLSWQFAQESIGGLVGRIDARAPATAPHVGTILLYPGLSAVADMPAPDGTDNADSGYYNTSLPAVSLGFRGLYGIDTAGSVNAWPAYDQVEFYPGCDPFGDGVGTVVFGALLRGGSGGIVANQADKQPVSGDGFDLVQTAAHAPDNGATVATGTTGASGYGSADGGGTGAMLRSSWSYGDPDETPPVPGTQGSGQTRRQASPVRTVPHSPAWNRRRHRFSYLLPSPVEPGEWISLDVSPTGRIARAYTRDGGIQVGVATDPHGATWDDADSGIPGDPRQPCIRCRTASRDADLVIAYVASGGAGAVERRQSSTEGVSWGVASTIFAAGHTRPTFDVTPTGEEVYCARTSGGGIARRSLSASGVEVQPLGTVVASDVADDAIALVCRPQDAVLVLSYHKDSDGSLVTVKSLDGGKTFS